MCDSCKSTNDMDAVLKMVEKDNEFMRKEIQSLREEIDLLRMRIPPCPCGFTEMNYSKTTDED